MLRSLIRYPYQLCNCLVITKMVERVPISCLGLFQHQWVRLGAYGMDCQLGAASLQTVDHGGRAITFWSQRWDTAYLRVTLLSYVTFWHFYIFPLLNIDQCFSSTFFFVSFSHFFDVLPFIDSLLLGHNAKMIKQAWNRYLYWFQYFIGRKIL